MNKFYLIDNNIFYLSSLQSQLRAVDCHVFANHGDTGEAHTFREILKHQPSIVIMDLVLPSFDGISLLHRLQEDHHTNDIPVAIYTSASNKHLKDKSIDKGVQHFFSKEDFMPEALINRLAKISRKNI